MHWLSGWLRSQPRRGDVLLAVAVALFDAAFWLSSNDPAQASIGFALAAPLVVRRRAPLAVAYLELPGALLRLTVQDPVQLIRPADVALCLALYTVVVYCGRRAALLYSALLVIGAAVWTARVGSSVYVALIPLLAFACAWALGEFSAARRAYLLATEDRVRRLEAERDQQTRIAVAAERARIARELHDVVAHAVGVVVVQADGASYALARDPELARAALDTISATGRQALVELRRLVGVLRSEEDAAALTPQPGVAALEELASTVGRVGLPVRLDLRGALDGLPAGVGLGIFRIVQEALTNALKHAGPDATATVEVVRDGETVRIAVTDTGQARAPLPPWPLEQPADHPVELPGPSEPGRGPGHGLLGMRERAAVLGGILHAGPRAGGGWQVRVALPLEE